MRLRRRVRREVEGKKDGLLKCFIQREKKVPHYFYMYQGKDLGDPTRRFLMMARYLPGNQEFRIYTTNNKLYALDEDSHTAILTINRERKLFVIKNRHCLRCS